MSEIPISSIDKLGLRELKVIDSATKKPGVSTSESATYHAGRRVVRNLLSTVSITTSALNSTTYFPFIKDNKICGVMRWCI